MNSTIIAEVETEVKLGPAVRLCCVCHNPFTPDDELQVLCPGCEALGTRCGCVMPWQSCIVCEATEALVAGAGRGWWGYRAREVC